MMGPLDEPVLNIPEFEFVEILCKKNNSQNIINKLFGNLFITNNNFQDYFHKEIIPLIPFVNKTSESSAPNVILLAIDSTSFVNFKRHFIRTAKLLNKHNFFELKGYTKVGENTFPNMMPFLSGYQYNELVTDAELEKMQFDGWPLIWKKYEEQGFVTTFVEEMPKYGLFQYNRKGFKYKPTDYYTRPFQSELEKDTNHVFCYKNKAEFEVSVFWVLFEIN